MMTSIKKCNYSCLPVPRIVENRESVEQKVWIEGLLADSHSLKDCKQDVETREEKQLLIRC